MFCVLFLKIALSSAELMSFGHLVTVIWHRWTIICGMMNDKCYADKPEAIDALKDNIHEAIGEIQLHTINNVLKNWTNRVGHAVGQPRQPFEWNYFPLLTERIVLSNKKKKFEKIFRSFFKAFSNKKRYLVDLIDWFIQVDYSARNISINLWVRLLLW